MPALPHSLRHGHGGAKNDDRADRPPDCKWGDTKARAMTWPRLCSFSRAAAQDAEGEAIG
jgi:hypothetical protein